MPQGIVKATKEIVNKFNQPAIWLIVESDGNEFKGNVASNSCNCAKGDQVEFELNKAGYVSKVVTISSSSNTSNSSSNVNTGGKSYSSSKTLSYNQAIEEYEKRMDFRVHILNITMEKLAKIGEFTSEDVRAISTSVMMGIEKNFQIDYNIPTTQESTTQEQSSVPTNELPF